MGKAQQKWRQCHLGMPCTDRKFRCGIMVAGNGREGLLFDPEKYFIVCANVLGGCYGTTGPASVNKLTGKPWLRDFPLITIRDLVNVHEILRNHLGIKKIHTIIGASIGGYQALEYSIMFPDLIERLDRAGFRSQANSLGSCLQRINAPCNGSRSDICCR